MPINITMFLKFSFVKKVWSVLQCSSSKLRGIGFGGVWLCLFIGLSPAFAESSVESSSVSSGEMKNDCCNCQRRQPGTTPFGFAFQLAGLSATSPGWGMRATYTYLPKLDFDVIGSYSRFSLIFNEYWRTMFELNARYFFTQPFYLGGGLSYAYTGYKRKVLINSLQEKRSEKVSINLISPQLFVGTEWTGDHIVFGIDWIGASYPLINFNYQEEYGKWQMSELDQNRRDRNKKRLESMPGLHFLRLYFGAAI